MMDTYKNKDIFNEEKGFKPTSTDINQYNAGITQFAEESDYSKTRSLINSLKLNKKFQNNP